MYTPIPISNRNTPENITDSNSRAESLNQSQSPDGALAAFGISMDANNNSTNNQENINRPNSGFSSILNTLGIRQSTNNLPGSTTNPFRNSNNSTPLQTSEEPTHSPLPISLALNTRNNLNNHSAANHNSEDGNNLQQRIASINNIQTTSQSQNGQSHNNETTDELSNANNNIPILEDINGNDDSNDEINNNDLNHNAAAGTTILKNLRHYVYAAGQPNADELLQLDLANGITLPAPLPADELIHRKDKHGLFSIRLTPFIDSTSTSNQGLFFDPIIRTAGPGSQLVIGRYTERVREAIAKLPEQFHPVVFKSKVISRAHGCFKVDSEGNWFVKDVRSSSGTFLNHQRLAPASALSKDFLLHDGDVLQLGMDFRGGTEEIYRCVKMRIELNKSWKRKANAFNKEALQRIKNLQKLTNGGVEEEDCSICLSKIKPCQAIFISPCSHSWHFHCIRRLVMLSYPQFMCPNCRSTCDLETTLESSESEFESDDEPIEDTRNDNNQMIDNLGVHLEDAKDIIMDEN